MTSLSVVGLTRTKFPCLGVPWPRLSLPGATGPNRHHAWLRRLFWVPHSHPQSQKHGSWLLQKIAGHSLLVYLVWALPCPLAPMPLQRSQLSLTVRKPPFHCLHVTPSLLDAETSVFSLCLPCEMLLRVPFWHRRSLSCFMMPLWCRQSRSRWSCDPLSLLLRTSNDRSWFWWTSVSGCSKPVSYTVVCCLFRTINWFIQSTYSLVFIWSLFYKLLWLFQIHFFLYCWVQESRLDIKLRHHMALLRW